MFASVKEREVIKKVKANYIACKISKNINWKTLLGHISTG